jgi:hypothetical protein
VKKLSWILLLWGLVPTLSAQVDNAAVEFGNVPEPDSGKWNLGIEYLSYLKNNEYYTPINPGQTWFGMQVLPTVQFRPARPLLFRAGVFMQREYGSTLFTDRILPWFSLAYQTGNWRFQAGNLNSAVNHRMIEPMLDYETAFYRRMEYGMMARRLKQNSEWETWIDWQRNIRRDDPFQERFLVGSRFNGRLLGGKDWQLRLPLHMTLFHAGGQINTGPEPNVSKLNTAGGLRLELAKGRIALETHLLHSFDFSPNPVQPWIDGHAWYSNAVFRVKKNWQITATRWLGTEWQSPVGGPIFGGVNNYDVYLNERVRELWMLRLQHVREILPGFWFDFRLEPHYDGNLGRMELSHGLFFSYRNRLWKGCQSPLDGSRPIQQTAQ